MKSSLQSRIQLSLIIALSCAIALAIFSGWREVGIDRANYLDMYEGVISNEDWSIRLWYAKDILFLASAMFSNYIGDEPRIAFLIICSLSTFLKYYSIRKIAPQYTLPFILLYAVFLAPGLEFAAMRGALAIGFFMLAVAYSDQKIRFTLLSALTGMAHMTAALPIIFAIRPINIFLSKHKSSFIAICIGVSLSATALLNIFPHGIDYEGNHGTLLAYSEPLATLFITWLVFFGLDKVSALHPMDKTFKYLRVIRPIVYCLIAIAFGISGVVVTAATRYLEISWCFLLLVSIVMFKKSLINKLGGLILLFFLTYINMIRLTWLAIASPNFG
jgi:hypothetical protein